MTDERKSVVLPFDSLKRPPKTAVGFDGIPRTQEQEQKLNSLFAATFQGQSAERVLDYIEGLTLRTVSPADASGDQLHYREGMRFMASIILERVRKGREGK